MAVYTEETFNYEILLRFGDTDPNKGKLTGAHLAQITQVYKDGVPFGPAVPGSPQQLALLEGEDGQMLSDVLGEVNAATIVENQQLQGLIATQQADIENYLSHANEQQTQLDQLNQQLGAEQAQNVTLQNQLNAANVEIARLNALLADQSTAEQIPDSEALNVAEPYTNETSVVSP